MKNQNQTEQWKSLEILPFSAEDFAENAQHLLTEFEGMTPFQALTIALQHEQNLMLNSIGEELSESNEKLKELIQAIHSLDSLG